MASTPWPPHLRKAVDSLMYDRRITEGKADPAAKTADTTALVEAPPPSQRTSAITLISHELSRTGAPILLRDVASALHDMKVATTVISLRTGPLADDYTDMHSPVVTEPGLSRILGSAGNFFLRLGSDPRVPGLAHRPFKLVANISAALGSRLRLLRYRTKANSKGPLLINSFASWPIAMPLLEKWHGQAFWYIHETYEPSLVMRSGRYLARLKALAGSGRLTFLFGSDATRQKWAEEGFDGEVFYWSGFRQSCEGRSARLSNPPVREKRIILSVQSTGPRKGTRTLIEAFAIGREKGVIQDDVELHIIGAHPPSNHPMSQDLLCRILKDDLRGRVQLIPNLSPEELDTHYAAAAVYVQSSTMECLPLALLNAMAYGLPIVSTDADGCREAIVNGKTGLLIPPRQPDLMADALGTLLKDHKMAGQLGEQAKTLFTDKFALEVTAPHLMKRLMR